MTKQRPTGQTKTSRAMSKGSLKIEPESSRVNEGHCNVAGAIGGGQAFVEVSQPSWVHEAPTFPWRIDRTVISMETATSTLMGKKESINYCTYQTIRLNYQLHM